MRGIASGVLALAALLAVPLPASSQIAVRERVTVRQLEEMLTAAHTSRLWTRMLPRKSAALSRPSGSPKATLSRLSRDHGEGAKLALRILADESAFLDPPAAELPAEGPPALEEQKAIVERAFDYARGYIGNLPNFRCHAEGPPFRRRSFPGPPKRDCQPGALTSRDSMVSDLAFENGRSPSRRAS